MENTRKLKVYSRTVSSGKLPNCTYKEIPQIILQGEWLKKFDLHPADQLELFCEEGQIVIRKIIS